MGVMLIIYKLVSRSFDMPSSTAQPKTKILRNHQARQNYHERYSNRYGINKKGISGNKINYDQDAQLLGPNYFALFPNVYLTKTLPV